MFKMRDLAGNVCVEETTHSILLNQMKYVLLDLQRLNAIIAFVVCTKKPLFHGNTPWRKRETLNALKIFWKQKMEDEED